MPIKKERVERKVVVTWIVLVTLSFLSLALLFLYPSKVGPSLAPPTDSVAYYQLENNLNDNTNVHNGVAVGNVSFMVGGVDQYSILFDGSSYITASSTESTYLTSDFSVSFWIYPTAVPLANQRYRVIGKGELDYAELDITYEDLSPNIGIYALVARQGDTHNAPLISLDSDDTIPVNEWNYITVTVSGNTVSFYVDGALMNTGTRSAAPVPVGDAITLAGSPQGQYFQGALDEVLIFNRAITPVEIAELYANQSARRTLKVPSAQTCTSKGYQAGKVWCCDASCATYDLSACYNITSTCTDVDPGTYNNSVASNTNLSALKTYGPNCQGITPPAQTNTSFASALDICIDPSTLAERSCAADGQSITTTSLTCTAGCSNAACLSTDNVVIHYPFDLATNITLQELLFYDVSGRNNHARSINGLRTSIIPNGNIVANFDGISQIIHTPNISGIPANKYTVTVWMLKQGIANGSIIRLLPDHGEIYANNNQIYYRASGGLASGTFGSINQSWNQVGFVFNGTASTLYFNGARVFSWPQVALPSPANQISIGYGNSTYWSYFTGSLDEVYVYSDTLSDAQMQTKYNTQKALFGEPAVLTQLAAPTSLTASYVSSTEISLQWNDVSSGEEGFVIERYNFTTSQWKAIRVVGSNAASSRDTNQGNSFLANTDHRYRIYAYGSGYINSTYSNEVTIRTPAAQTTTTTQSTSSSSTTSSSSSSGSSSSTTSTASTTTTQTETPASDIVSAPEQQNSTNSSITPGSQPGPGKGIIVVFGVIGVLVIGLISFGIYIWEKNQKGNNISQTAAIPLTSPLSQATATNTPKTTDTKDKNKA